jgi:hypothetical protein
VIQISRADVYRREGCEEKAMTVMKEKGRCENCSTGGFLEAVEVTRVDSTAPPHKLRLCKRCASVPNAVWRRRYRPVQHAA